MFEACGKKKSQALVKKQKAITSIKTKTVDKLFIVSYKDNITIMCHDSGAFEKQKMKPQFKNKTNYKEVLLPSKTFMTN